MVKEWNMVKDGLFHYDFHYDFRPISPTLFHKYKFKPKKFPLKPSEAMHRFELSWCPWWMAWMAWMAWSSPIYWLLQLPINRAALNTNEPWEPWDQKHPPEFVPCMSSSWPNSQIAEGLSDIYLERYVNRPSCGLVIIFPRSIQVSYPVTSPINSYFFWWSGSSFDGAWEVCTARLFRRRHLGKSTARFALKPRYAGSRVSKITELSTFQPSTYFNQLKSRVSPKKFGHESGQDSSLKIASVDPQQLPVEPLSLPSRSVEQQWVHHPPGPRRSVGSH